MILSYISEHCDSVDPYIMKNVFQSIKKKAGAGGLKSLYGKYRGRWRKSSKKLCPFDFCFLRPTNFRNSTANDRRNIERYAWMNTSGWWLPSAEFWCLFIKVYLTVDLTADVKLHFGLKNFIVSKVRGGQVV